MPRSTWNSEAPAGRFIAAMKDGADEKGGIAFSAAQLGAFARYYTELTRWRRAMNLTGLERPEDVARDLFLDSAVALPLVEGASSLLDVGSGAGFPGLVLAILMPRSSFVLLDASAKRIEFLRHVVRMLGLDKVLPMRGRWPEEPVDGRFDFILSKAAFSDLNTWRGSQDRLTAKGSLLLWRGQAAEGDIPGFSSDRRPVRLPGLSKPRYLLLARAT